MTGDERRSAALLFGEELALGTIDRGAIEVEAVRAAVRDRPVPSWMSRRLQRRMTTGGGLSFEEHSVGPMMAARRAVLGDAAAGGPPRVLLRIGTFPHPDAEREPERCGTARFVAAADALLELEVPFLVAVAPRDTRPPADPMPVGDDEARVLRRLRDAGVTFGLDGAGERLERERLDHADAALRALGLAPDVVVPTGDVIDPRTWNVVAERYAVITGGPASVADMGWHPAPLWRGAAVYLPATPPLHATAREVAAAVQRLADADTALWIPAVIDWARESPEDLRALGEALRGLARSWDEFLAAVRATRAASG